MALIDWKPNYSVGVPSIDNQHQTWIGLINSLHEAMMRRAGREVMGKVLDDVAAYTQTHFREEERLMAQANYAGLAQHKGIHAKFEAEMAQVRDSFKAGKEPVTVEVMSTLKNWLVDHILKTDMAYSQPLASKGIK